VTLLERLARSGDQDQTAWAEFVHHYGAKIYRWCLHWKLQEADAQDVTQLVLTKLAKRMRTFVYDPGSSFRAWLKTVARHAWQDFQTQRERPGRGTGDSVVHQVLESIEAREDLVRSLEEEFDHELLEEAMRRVRLRVEPHSWEAFRLHALEGLSTPEVAQRLQMRVTNVYKARASVLAKLQQEREALEARQLGRPIQES
jgi:RNA polymerase sigma-70 factor (ECF subfamily)